MALWGPMNIFFGAFPIYETGHCTITRVIKQSVRKSHEKVQILLNQSTFHRYRMKLSSFFANGLFSWIKYPECLKQQCLQYISRVGGGEWGAAAWVSWALPPLHRCRSFSSIIQAQLTLREVSSAQTQSLPWSTLATQLVRTRAIQQQFAFCIFCFWSIKDFWAKISKSGKKMSGTDDLAAKRIEKLNNSEKKSCLTV